MNINDMLTQILSQIPPDELGRLISEIQNPQKLTGAGNFGGTPAMPGMRGTALQPRREI